MPGKRVAPFGAIETSRRYTAATARALIGCLAALMLLSHAVAEENVPATERIGWRKVPIELQLRVGEERLVHFPGAVKVGVPAKLQPVLRTQSVSGTVYLLAHQAFGPSRLVVRATESGRIYLLDVSASETGGSVAPVEIHDPDGSAPDAGHDRSRPAGVSTLGYVALTRFAAQQLYAPSRLLRNLPGVVRVPVHREPVALVRGGAVEAVPVAAWRTGDRYLTAVKLTNKAVLPRTLDPRALRGTWLTATFQHNRLFAAGDEADTTALYLISARPFEASVR